MMRRGPMIASGALACGWLLASALALAAGRVEAQNLRDPTRAPLEAGPASPDPGQKPLLLEPGAAAIIVREGRPYLVIGTRLYATGQQLGPARIERISETEVWLREGGVLRKVAQFPGIERRAVPPASTRQANKAAGAAKATSSAPTPTSTPLVPGPGGPARVSTP